MVLLKSPSPKRGGSPQRHANGQRSTSQEQRERDNRRSRGISPSEKSNVSRGNSPAKSSAGSKGKSPSLRASRGSEIGSIERLADGDRRIIASKHPLPEDNINVVVRVRPLSKKEKKSGEDCAVHFPGRGQIYCEGFPNSGDKKAKLFSYNVVFEPAASQEDILQFSGIKKLIEMAIEGFSTTAFCYGQTGSGKTHTLTGPPGLFENGNPYSEDHGLVFRSFVYLFKILQERKEFNFVLKASFLEIYNEKVIDLLNPGTSRKPLAVRWSKKIRGFFVENLFTVECEELDDLLAVLEEGMRNRSVGTHNMNEHSSRSHTILTVHITSEQQMENGVFISKQGKINFVDLAGSEMTKKTQSEGKTLEEANNINKSLMVLGYCIASLSDGKKKTGHIPYRDSKLTKLLADSLAGNGVTLMITCVSPARSNSSETLNTLRYASRAKKIRTKPIVVMDPREALILSLKREVAALQTENDHLRGALHIDNVSPGAKRSDSKGEERRVLRTPPAVDLDKLAELESTELSQLLRAYITENEALRRENAELYATREQVMRDQELVCRENERLLKKLEDVNSVCCRSPIIPARPTYSAEMLQNSIEDAPGATNVWTNPNADTNGTPSYTTSSAPRRVGSVKPYLNIYDVTYEQGSKVSDRESRGNIPHKLLKELDKRIVGSFSNIVEAYRDKISHHRRHNSWDNSRGSGGSPDQAYSPVEMNHRSRNSALRRTSTVPEEMTSSSVADVLGGPVLPISHSLNGTPDSLMSGPLLVDGRNSAPDTGESVDPTTPFPPISSLRVSSPFTVLDDGRTRSEQSKPRRTTRHSPGNEDQEDRSTRRAFGSPVSLDERDNARF